MCVLCVSVSVCVSVCVCVPAKCILGKSVCEHEPFTCWSFSHLPQKKIPPATRPPLHRGSGRQQPLDAARWRGPSGQVGWHLHRQKQMVRARVSQQNPHKHTHTIHPCSAHLSFALSLYSIYNVHIEPSVAQQP